jgi:homoserine kinase type II
MDDQKTGSVFLLWHTRELEDDIEENKLIGVYDSREKAQAAQARVCDKPGFRDYPDGFLIDEAVLNRDEWTDGFVTRDSRLARVTCASSELTRAVPSKPIPIPRVPVR